MNKFLLASAMVCTAGAAMAAWSNDPAQPVDIFPEGTISYATRVLPGPEGDAWAMVYHPNLRNAGGETDIDNVVYEYRLQHFDKAGNPTFPEEGMLLCDYKNWSYTVVNDYLLVDSDGNCIVVVNDCRNSSDRGKSYTAYKVAPDGTLLWGEDGVAVSDPLKPTNLAVMMNIIELEDHSYVFAWAEYSDNYDDTSSVVCLQRLNKDGVAQWDLSKSTINDVVAGYPFLVNSGDNTFILVYTRTASNIVYARKLDFECENVWGKDVRIYRGGWGTTPIHTNLHVTSSGDGGALISWCDDRKAINIESPYLSYVTSDGKLGFSGASDEADCKLAYKDNRCLNVYAAPAPDGSCFYAIWRELCSSSQSVQCVSMQKISKTGEILWGDEAKPLFPEKTCSLGYLSLQPAGQSDACAFFQEYKDYNEQVCYASRFDADGNFVWPDNYLAISVPGHKCASLESAVMPGQNAWLANWHDEGTTDDKTNTYQMTRVNEDGTLGLPSDGLTNLKSENSTVYFLDNAIYAPGHEGETVKIYDATGAYACSSRVSEGKAVVSLAPSLYVAVLPGAQSIKFICK